MQFRPCIDIHNGQVKQIVGGTLESNNLVENFVADKDAAYFAEMYKQDRLTGGHVIMLGPGNDEEALKALHAYFGGLQIGGGINAENAAYFLEQGASHVIVTSYVFKDGRINFDNLDKLVAEVGHDRLVLDLSCRARDGTYFVVTDRWQKFTDYEVNPLNIRELDQYCDEFLIHAADVEGRCKGIQEDLVEKLGKWTKIPTIYAGGAKDLSDLDFVNRLGEGRIDLTIGSALDIFGGICLILKLYPGNLKTQNASI